MDHMNQVGMVLEFLSFWLVTPEIVGEERLRRAQRWVREVLQGVTRWWSIIFGIPVLVAFISLFVLTLKAEGLRNWDVELIDLESGLNLPVVFTWMAGSWGMSAGIWSVIRNKRVFADFQGCAGGYFRGVMWLMAILSLFFTVSIASLILAIPFVNEPLMPDPNWGWSIGAGITGVSALTMAIMGVLGWTNWRVWGAAVMAGGISGITWWVFGFGAYETAGEVFTLSLIILGIFIVLQERVLPFWLGEMADSARTRRRLFWLGVSCFVMGFVLQFVGTF